MAIRMIIIIVSLMRLRVNTVESRDAGLSI